MAPIIRIRVSNGQCEETYYEPVASDLQDALALLRRAGWRVRTRRVDADKEIALLRAQAEEAACEGARLRGASSEWLSYMVLAKRLERLAQDAEAAVQGKGTLLNME